MTKLERTIFGAVATAWLLLFAVVLGRGDQDWLCRICGF